MPDKEANELEVLLAGVVRGFFRPSLEDPLSELTHAQLRTLRAIEEGVDSASTLGEQLGLTVSAVTQVVNRLEVLDLIDRKEDSHDRRIKPLVLTDHCKALFEKRRDVRICKINAALAHLSDQERDEVLEGFRLLYSAWQMEQAACGVPSVCDEDRLPRPSEET